MYRVKYYTYEILHFRTFETLHDAVMFAVYQVRTGNVYGIDLIK
jgi:hypothetical protein